MANPYLSNMDDVASLLVAANVGNRNEQLEKQLAAAKALRQRPQRQNKTGAQATLGGLADALNQVSGFVGEKYTQQQIDQNLGRMEDPRTLAPILQKQQAQAAAIRGQQSNPLAAAEEAVRLAAENPDMAQLALPAQPGAMPMNAGMGDILPGGMAAQKGRGLAEAGPRLRRLQPFGFGPALS